MISAYVAKFIKQPDFSGIVHINLQNVFMFTIMPNCVCSLLKNKNILTHKTVRWAYSVFQMQYSCLLKPIYNLSCPTNTILLESLLLRPVDSMILSK